MTLAFRVPLTASGLRVVILNIEDEFVIIINIVIIVIIVIITIKLFFLENTNLFFYDSKLTCW